MKIETTSILRLPAFRIPTPISLLNRAIVYDMFDIMYKAKGVGLAAPQVGLAAAIAVIDTGAPGEKLVLINPTITHREGRRVMTEGCLSLPGEAHVVVRSRLVEVCYTDMDGKEQRLRCRKSYLGQVIEHETDHLRGVLIDGERHA